MKAILVLITSLWSFLALGQQKPNIVLILADDMGWGDLSMHNNPVVETPVLDRLAAQGAQFERFFVSPLCAPSRSSLLTGRYHLRTGVASVTNGLETMRTNEVTLAELFKKAGYATGAFGKWHNGAHYPENPQGQGFQEFLGFCGGHWTNYFNTTLQHNGNEVKTNGYITDVLTEAALGFITQNKDKPFFCYIPYNAPHGPFQVPDSFFTKYKAKDIPDREAAIYGMVDNLDGNVGRILQRLNDLKLSENTIVVFLTDNGPNSDRFNGDMKGRKGGVDEGGVRVPLFIRWPGKIKPRTVIKPIAAHIDLLPTLADLAGISTLTSLPIDGKSLAPLLRNETVVWPERILYTHVLRTDTAKTVSPYPGAARSSQYRFIRGKDADQLYDMLADPGQKQDIASQKVAITKEMRDKYDHWFEDVMKKGIHPEITSVGYSQSPTTELFAPDATKEGHLNYFAKNGFAHDWFTGWQQSDDAAVWTIDIVETGAYQISLKYNCPEDFMGNKISVIVDGEKLEKPIQKAYVGPVYPSPDRVKRIEAFEKDWATVNLGQLTLPKGVHKLYVHGVGNSPVPFELKSVLMEKR